MTIDTPAAPLTQRPRVISIGIVTRDDGAILVFEAFDRSKGSWFYRPLGGAVEFGETAAAALVREIHEELSLEVTDVSLLGVLENLFMYEGRPGHEVVFVHACRLADASAYGREAMEGVEDNGEPMRVVWRRLDSFDAGHRLVPEALGEMLLARR